MYKAQIYIEYINRYTIIFDIKILLEEAIMKKCLKRLLGGGKFFKVSEAELNILQL